MIDVVMKDGRVLRYNSAKNISLFGDFVSVDGTGWIARIHKDSIERIDGTKPCRVMKESRDKKRMNPY
jgi:hypothetical protein